MLYSARHAICSWSNVEIDVAKAVAVNGGSQRRQSTARGDGMRAKNDVMLNYSSIEVQEALNRTRRAAIVHWRKLVVEGQVPDYLLASHSLAIKLSPILQLGVGGWGGGGVKAGPASGRSS